MSGYVKSLELSLMCSKSFTMHCPGALDAQQSGWCSSRIDWGHGGSEAMDAQLEMSELGL